MSLGNTVPVISPVAGTGALINSRYSRLYANPHFDYLSEMLPKDIKELFRWCEIVYQSMPVVSNGVRKLINYPVTDFSCTSDSEKIRKVTKDLLDTLHIKSVLLEFGTDYYVYGNVFRSVYMPFKRMLKCKDCGTEVALDTADFSVKKKSLIMLCPKCHRKTIAEIHDVNTNDIKSIRIVRWDPKQIELTHNPITGSVTYCYELPKSFVQGVLRGDKTIFHDTPKLFIDAALAGRNVQMGTNFYHAKTTSLSGFSSGWGIPPLMATLKNYMYIAVLRRAAESIGMEHITPQRILFPQSPGTSDPCVSSSMSRWQTEVTRAVERWRMDPNYIMTAPFPTGVANIGSQGRNLIPTEEIKDARMELALALDIPPGIIMGDTNIQNSAVALRILENQLTPYVEQLNDFANWIISCVNSHMNKDYGDIELIPFRLADDLMNKQMLLQMAQTGSVSQATLQESLNLDPDQERDRIIDEQVKGQEMQAEVEERVNAKQNDLAAQAQAAEQEQETGMPSQYNQQKMIAQAQEICMQLMQMPYEQRKSALAQLQNEDYVMWAIVSKQLESMQQQQKNEAAAAAMQGEAQGGM